MARTRNGSAAIMSAAWKIVESGLKKMTHREMKLVLDKAAEFLVIVPGSMARAPKATKPKTGATKKKVTRRTRTKKVATRKVK